MNVVRQAWHRLNPIWMQTLRSTERMIQYARAFPTKWRRRDWPRQRDIECERRNVGIVIVSYNTKDHTARLLYSIYRNLDLSRIPRIVVIDNASTDGSLEMLQTMQRAKLIDLLVNRTQRYHGPGVNQGIHWLREATCQPNSPPIDYVWVLDSDTVIIDGSVLDDAITIMQRERAGVVGEFQYGLVSLPQGYAHICSLLLDPLMVWRKGIEPMHESGTPAEAMQISCEKRGVGRLNFGFMSLGGVIHLGSGTLSSIANQDIGTNRYYDWAKSIGSNEHFHGVPDAPVKYALFVEEYSASVGQRAEITLAGVCLNLRKNVPVKPLQVAATKGP